MYATNFYHSTGSGMGHIGFPLPGRPQLPATAWPDRYRWGGGRIGGPKGNWGCHTADLSALAFSDKKKEPGEQKIPRGDGGLYSRELSFFSSGRGGAASGPQKKFSSRFFPKAELNWRRIIERNRGTQDFHTTVQNAMRDHVEKKKLRRIAHKHTTSVIPQPTGFPEPKGLRKSRSCKGPRRFPQRFPSGIKSQ